MNSNKKATNTKTAQKPASPDSSKGGFLRNLFRWNTDNDEGHDGEECAPASKSKTKAKASTNTDKNKKKSSPSTKSNKGKDSPHSGPPPPPNRKPKMQPKPKKKKPIVGNDKPIKIPVPKTFEDADPDKWIFKELSLDGTIRYETTGRKEEIMGGKMSIEEACSYFQKNPERYTALTYQNSLTRAPEHKQKFTLVHREGTFRYRPCGVREDKKGWMTMLLYEYRPLPVFEGNVLPEKFRDKYTDDMTHQGKRLHSRKRLPVLPGRGMGYCDAPSIKLIGDIDPSDIAQGTVGDCWLLGAISCLAEFDGAVSRLFRKTKMLDQRPLKGPNMYTVTLWDLSTWKEVDIEIDERLPVMADGSGKLLSARPTADNELWVAYLEKAIAAHCGGWDKITGGQCTHAWALMTGCKNQYEIWKNPKTGLFGCYSKYSPNKKRWNEHANCPHEGDNRFWRVEWPAVGGGGGRDKECTEDELFMKMWAWDKENYIVAAGTTGMSNAGMEEDHAYSVIESHNNVAGTNIDLLKVRNPWGKGEIENGMFDDDGPGWEKYPQIKKKLKPTIADDGIFWVTKQEFFKYFSNIYLSASNMTKFLED